MRVLVFGDSIAQGFFDANGGWVEAVRRSYDAVTVENRDFTQPTVFNLSVSGDLTENVLNRFENEVIARRWPGEEFAFVFATGTNDSQLVTDKPISNPGLYKLHLGELLGVARKYSSKILFVGLFPVIDELLQNPVWAREVRYSTERMKLFENTLEQFCVDNKVALVKPWISFERKEGLEDAFFDGIHPNGEGHQLIADLVKPKLQELLNA